MALIARRKSTTIVGFVVLFVVVVFFAGFGYIMSVGNQTAADPGVPEQEFMIEAGEGIAVIAGNLEEQELIRSAFYFKIYATFQGVAKDIQAGQYFLTPSDSMETLLSKLSSGTVDQEVQVTIPEGLRIDEVADIFEQAELFSAADFIASASEDYDNAIVAHLPAGETLEGYLYPDTYRFFRDATPRDAIEKMLANLANRLEPLLGQIEQNSLSLHEIMTLASIVEGEISGQVDRTIVASIFLNRLEIGMALQSDATVNYVTRKDDPTPSFADLDTESLYNTYQHNNLPPGPINNPSVASIKAVLNPADTDYFYFLTKLDTGEPIYSRTLEEHNAAKAEFLR